MIEKFKAVSTPLASIFGSGFLVIVPVLAGAVGDLAPYAMLFVCVLAWCVGSTIRHNIMQVEPVLASNPPEATLSLERCADFALVLAYIVSVCLYIHILSAFVLAGIGIDTVLNENILTTAVIAVITIIGLTRGLSFLETLEAWSLVAILIIVLALMAGFAWYDFGRHSPAEWQMPVAPGRSAWEVATIVGGTLIVVQGFETTRYLGAQYSPETRVSASRWSQIIATAVYLCFVALAVPLLFTLDGQYNDHSLIQLTDAAAAILVTPLIIAAALSQFSAAVADTLAAAGNLDELTHGHLNSRWAYLIVGIVAIALTWTAHTYEILSLASRAFALYYMLQCFVAISVSTSTLRRIGFAMLSVVLGFITIFAVPAG